MSVPDRSRVQAIKSRPAAVALRAYIDGTIRPRLSRLNSIQIGGARIRTPASTSSSIVDDRELGFSYADADRVLFLLVDIRYRVDDLVEMGFEREFVERIRRRMVGSQFKRRLPLWPKVSPRTIGLDFRYPRDWET